MNTNWKAPLDDDGRPMIEVTPEQWDALDTREQAKADRRWNRRRDMVVLAAGTLVGGAFGCGLLILRAVWS